MTELDDHKAQPKRIFSVGTEINGPQSETKENCFVTYSRARLHFSPANVVILNRPKSFYETTLTLTF